MIRRPSFSSPLANSLSDATTCHHSNKLTQYDPAHTEPDKALEVTVCARANYDEAFTSLLHDPLIRLVMASDGVTDDAMIDLMTQVRQAIAAREQPRRPALNVQRAPLNRERRLFHRLLQCGVRMTGPCDVLG